MGKDQSQQWKLTLVSIWSRQATTDLAKNGDVQKSRKKQKPALLFWVH